MAGVDVNGSGSTEDVLDGLDALEVGTGPRDGRGRRNVQLATGARALLASVWPKLVAIGVALVAWQLVVWSGWRPPYVLPPPFAVLDRLAGELSAGALLSAAGITVRRALAGYTMAVGLGVAAGLAVSRLRPLRTAVGSLITGLQTMPSIAWFPFAILLFGLSEAAILFVVVVGAAPSIANGLIAGIDHVPPLLLRSGRVLGARGWRLQRHVVLPAALPGLVAGLKQGWAFAWRSLMAGELLVVVSGHPSIGVRLQLARELSDSTGLIAAMLVVLLIGVAVDVALFGTAERRLRRRRGLVGA